MQTLRSLVLLAIALLAAGTVDAQRRRGSGIMHSEWQRTVDGDSILTVYAVPVPVYTRGIDRRRWARYVIAVKRVYPIAQLARQKMAVMEEELKKIEGRKEQRAYIKKVYKEILNEYTPVVKKMTRTQGRVLLKLIDRQTDYTAYEVLREFRGGFVAGFWQSVSRVFGQNLKSEYDAEGDDRMLEQIVRYYEAGLL